MADARQDEQDEQDELAQALVDGSSILAPGPPPVLTVEQIDRALVGGCISVGRHGLVTEADPTPQPGAPPIGWRGPRPRPGEVTNYREQVRIAGPEINTPGITPRMQPVRGMPGVFEIQGRRIRLSEWVDWRAVVELRAGECAYLDAPGLDEVVLEAVTAEDLTRGTRWVWTTGDVLWLRGKDRRLVALPVFSLLAGLGRLSIMQHALPIELAVELVPFEDNRAKRPAPLLRVHAVGKGKRAVE